MLSNSISALKKARFHTLVCFALLSLLFISCNEDTIEPRGEGSLAGEVLSAETGEPLAGASITTSPATSAVITDAAGKFKFETMPDGDYTVTAKKNGYKTEPVAVNVESGKLRQITIVLARSKDGNNAPNPPALPSPATDAANQPINLELKWQGTDPDKDEVLTYDVLLYEAGTTQKTRLAEGISDTSVIAKDLKYGTAYFWQVVAKDKLGGTTNGPVWSFTTLPLPDSRYLFVRTVDGNSDIYSATGANATEYKLTSSYAREWWPVINPKKRDRIAYSSNITLEPHIWVMNRDGSDKRRVTNLPVAGYHNAGIGFAWSPDGTHLIYANYDKLYRIESNGANLRLIATAPANRHFRMMDWTEQGNKIVVQTIGANIYDAEFYIMNADGTEMQLLVDNQPGRLESPSFSVDGKSILYTRDVAGFEMEQGSRQLNAHIFIQKLDGSGIIDVSINKPAGTNDLYPRFSPDGAKVIFVNTSNDDVSQADVWMVDAADGKNRVKLFSDATMPEWE